MVFAWPASALWAVHWPYVAWASGVPSVEVDGVAAVGVPVGAVGAPVAVVPPVEPVGAGVALVPPVEVPDGAVAVVPPVAVVEPVGAVGLVAVVVPLGTVTPAFARTPETALWTGAGRLLVAAAAPVAVITTAPAAAAAFAARIFVSMGFFLEIVVDGAVRTALRISATVKCSPGSSPAGTLRAV
ncbi:MAG: hypothetical protein NVS3B21_07350 [Acidimicrobiales bacterium]